ncbi:hypothetical protein L9F63_027240 [Diploptera punctata]|uniref:Uncharacterized protein n=1 Tax=Diploptera punctata TaxID=6984 RepID=A0AAD8ABQ7_DIPPU|nr:hypothetical protein L9F63_027240 [Diploptera punctata]
MMVLLILVIAVLHFVTVCNGVCEVMLGEDITLDCTSLGITNVSTLKIPVKVNTLQLSSNKITILEQGVFSNLENLRNLDLSDNKLCYIDPDTFSNNRNLDTVCLSYNTGIDLSDNSHFLVSTSIRSIELRHCELTSLSPKTFKQLPNLVTIDISHNNLTVINLETFNFIEQLISLDLRFNKWECDCQIVYVLNMISERRKREGLRINNNSPVKCMLDGKYETWWNATSHENGCQFQNSLTKESHIVNIPTSSEIIAINTNFSLAKVEKRKEMSTDSYVIVSEETKILIADPSVISNTNFSLAKVEKQKEMSTDSYVIVSEETKILIADPSVISNTNFSLAKVEKQKEMSTDSYVIVSEETKILIADPSVISSTSLKPETNTSNETRNFVLILVVLPITLGISFFISALAANRFTNWLEKKSGCRIRKCRVSWFCSICSDSGKASGEMSSTHSYEHVNGETHIYESVV